MPTDEVIVCGVPVPLPDAPGQCSSVTFGEGTDEEPAYEVVIRRRRRQEQEGLITENLRLRKLIDLETASPHTASLVEWLESRVNQLEDALLDACHLADTGWEEDHSRLRKMYGERISQLRAIAVHRYVPTKGTNGR